MATITKYNWKPVVRSFIGTLKRHGFDIQEVDNGEEHYMLLPATAVRNAVEHICSVDESRLLVVHNSNPRYQCNILIVLGNGPEEIAADWSYNSTIGDAILSKAIDEHYNRWERRKTPTTNEYNDSL